MYEYISFLRGINVGGNKVIKMENLKRMFELMGFENVRTYIQSGNVLFNTSFKKRNILNKQIEAHLLKSLGYRVETFTRSIPEMENIVQNNPYKNIVPDKRIKIYLTFMSSEPSLEDKNSLEKMSYDAEKFRIIGTELYTLLEKDKIKEKAIFNNSVIEKKLRLSSTTRDWNTINRILLIQ